MHIKKLTISGFKSYKNTVVELSPQTSIIGACALASGAQAQQLPPPLRATGACWAGGRRTAGARARRPPPPPPTSPARACPR